jgi:predicted ATPase
MTVDAIRLRNFRGFRDSTPIELKPLTVLLGPNSAGKSSFGHAAAAMAHSQWRHAGSAQATLTPKSAREAEEWPVDLGSLVDLRTSGTTGPVYIGLHTQEGWTEFGFGHDLLQDLRLSHVESPVGPTTSAPSIRATSDHAQSPPEVSSVVGPGRVEDREPASSAATVLTRVNEVQWRHGRGEVLLQLDGLIPLAAKHESGTPIPLSRESNLAIKKWLENLTYLRANRKRPSRSYLDQIGEQQRIGYAGEWTATILRENGSDQIVLVSPPGIASSVEDARKELDAPWQKHETTLVEAVAWWLRHLGLAIALESIHFPTDKRHLQVRVTLPGQRPHDITEIGFGVSQVLPVLTAGLAQPSESLLVVDLPESHLHPLPQARIADFFCSLALSGRRTLVETHSEMFFHRLRLRVEMHPELRDKIQLYFVDQPSDGHCSKPRPVGLSYDEELSWPVGFFQEGWETETQINTVRQARGRSPHA